MMDILIEIVSKMGTYAIIIGLTNLILRKTYLSDTFINENTNDTLEINKKYYAKIFFICAIIFTIIFSIVGSLPSNVSGFRKHLIAGIAIGLNCCVYVLAFYCYFDRVRIDKEGIYIRRGFLRKKRYYFDQIESYEINQSNRLVINLVEGKKFKLLSSEDDKNLQVEVMIKFCDHDIWPNKKDEKEKYSVKAPRFNMGCAMVFWSVSALLAWFTFVEGYLIGIILFGIPFLIFFIYFLNCAMNRIVVKENNITVVRLFKKTQYLSISDIKSKKIEEKENGSITYAYGYEKELFAYGKYERNANRIDKIMSNVPIKK